MLQRQIWSRGDATLRYPAADSDPQTVPTRFLREKGLMSETACHLADLTQSPARAAGRDPR